MKGQVVATSTRLAFVALLVPLTLSMAVAPARATTPKLAAWHHTIALRDDGSVWAWGQNFDGELGDGASGLAADRATPARVQGSGGTGYLSGIVAIAASTDHSLAVTADEGFVWGWGQNRSGQLGDGNSDPLGLKVTSPVQVLDSDGSGYLSDVVAVAAGGGWSLALKSDRTVWAWGWGGGGALGDGKTGPEPFETSPVRVVDVNDAALDDVIAIAAGDLHSVALKAGGGSVWTWGGNFYGQLGDETRGGNSDVAMQVVDEDGTGYLRDVIAISTRGLYTLALKRDGTVRAWGRNNTGQLGDGNLGTDSFVPVEVVGQDGTGELTDVVAIAAGANHGLALKQDGSVWAWGSNEYGQLGNPDSGTQSDIPVPVRNTDGTGPLTGVIAITAGFYHSLALLENGDMLAWGFNEDGQLGNNKLGTDSSLPVKVVGLSLDTMPPTTTAIPVGGEYRTTQAVTLTADDAVYPRPTIYYTTDGTTPTESSPSFDKSGILTFDEFGKTTVNFFAVDAAGRQEELQTYVYDLKPPVLSHGPNPASTSATFFLPVGEKGALYVYDAAGRLVWSTSVESGATRLDWNLVDYNGESLANGLYLYRLVREDGISSDVGKLVIVR